MGRGCQFFAARIFLTPGSIFSRGFDISQQNIEPGVRISYDSLTSSSILHGIKVLNDTGMQDITAFEHYTVRMHQRMYTDKRT